MERTQTRKLLVCDGCFDEIDSPAKTKTVFYERIDLCDECVDKGMWICSDCGRIHQEDEQCPEVRANTRLQAIGQTAPNA